MAKCAGVVHYTGLPGTNILAYLINLYAICMSTVLSLPIQEGFPGRGSLILSCVYFQERKSFWPSVIPYPRSSLVGGGETINEPV
jgi:hypothetical protein